ncbi:alpha-D-ribose 1-methylphosphonate 5-triphosphate diphosphatase [Undibacterium sp. CY18W]|uniref:Alpha-D-ribose 1-methylphosphonate 5-triphosphate diphosphatase n=1 Tax=Undibacterium hunanense TaxID=2762292 RepID=A0ABR6ZMD2_9BURK|nr:alpha-D-ribose 1-methylphosphonate 5-triphosphate diphosphatase [Undibacterium hunanense]MBC3917044.1 alpha-D-ribose 1-methylphosphonate 5-triphosphate diphosphatase [Undibacterium hunanense]
MNAHLSIQGGSYLHGADNQYGWSDASLHLASTQIARIGTSGFSSHAGLPVLDASGLLILPGLVDIHGDAFERQLQPRPATSFAYDIAFADTDRQLITNGITTACHGVTFSWEGGLRGRDAAMATLDQVAAQRSHVHADHRIHLRFENHHADGLHDALEWINAGMVAFFAFNEHLPSILKKSASPEKLQTYAERARCDVPVFLERLHKAQSRSTRVVQTIQQLAAACREHGIPMASHDDECRQDRERFQALGAEISEFPKTEEALQLAHTLNNHVIMGAPNVLLGGSHCGGLSATEAIRRGLCDILASDYYYPALLHAPFRLEQDGACSLEQAWQLVSRNPARVLGLHERGHIAEQQRADLVLVERQADGSPRLIATIAAGKLVFCAEPQRLSHQRSLELAA